MIDEANTLLSAVILLLAGGMWPVGMGYMFGVCSACCEECPDECSKCTHAYNDQGDVNIQGCASTIYGGTLSYGNVTINNPGVEPSSGCGDNSFNLDVANMPTTACSIGEIVNFANLGLPCIFAKELGAGVDFDECGCLVCGGFLILRALFGVNEDGFIVQGRFVSSCSFTIGDCDQTEAVCGPCVFEAFIDGPPDLPEDCNEIIIDYLNSLELTATLTVEPCDCGACCDNQTCEDNVAEGGCESWAGVGTACDDDPIPCPEAEE